MKQAIVFLLDEYADWEPSYIASILNSDTTWNVKTASIKPKVTSIGGFQVDVDYLIENIPQNIDLLALIGGNSWEITNSSIVKLVTYHLKQGNIVSAICGAVDFLAQNGLLEGYKHTGNTQFLWTDFESYTNAADFCEEQAVRDRNLITANGTAPLEFSQLCLEAVRFDEPKEITKTIDLYKMGYYGYVEKYGDPFS